ncbi:Max dimerization protein 1 [Amphibalanus amphitrite]|uniref:Max dimerization protein 1 n=1 Tax=Amphibalanus amphitrite TaxID=1232801 RepID=A0A6A4VMY3_AMPAM|nr:max dimerization protein 1-like [Amphibalanus amphitrite]XP_043200789.1 max dimerization protein 1-like [Amphibalanus amphitrite]XP_043200790.1 max dimerization protein 1-like [Amphibalanus amphitrite]KAF0295003.1 Max dimerization protein 1 [Amphibalanus amphitrite]
MSIAALLEAADFLERREREAEHGYAIVSVVPLPSRKVDSKLKAVKHPRSKRSFSHRSTHNELEKNRRAHLRECLERLREEVPPCPDSNRSTTLGLLTRARDFIRHLEEKDRMNFRYKTQLAREQRLLAERLAALTPRWRTPAKARASDSYSSGSDWSSVSSLSSAGSNFEWADSDDVESGGGSLSPGSDGSQEEADGAALGLASLAVTTGRRALLA